MDFWGYFQMRRRTILTAALGLLAALTIAGCSAPTTVTPPAEGADEPAVSETPGAEESEEPPAAEVGSRENPAPLGTSIETKEWRVVVNSVDLDATETVLTENPFNEAPADGNVIIMVNLTITYLGDEADGAMPWAAVAYVTPAGNTIDGTDKIIVPPDQLDTLSTLYNGASVTGNEAFEVPADGVENGVLAVTPDLLGDKTFVAVV